MNHNLIRLVCIVCALVSLIDTPCDAASKKVKKSAPVETQNRAGAAAGKQLDAGTRVALVIGNSSYANAPLKNPVNDAKDIADKLRELGFEVIERNNLTTRQIGGTLREFRSKLVPGAIALVFYAGHGLQIKGDNYLPAVDADINFEEDVPNQSLSMKQIMDVLDESKSRLNLVFLDACRNNPYARSFRSAERGLARVSAPSGTLISYATKPGSVAADGTGRNGLYTSKLLAQMDSNQQIEQTLKRVVTEVKTASKGKQEPWMEGSIEGDFCFGGCGTHINASGATTAVEPQSVPVIFDGDNPETALWIEVQKGNTKDDYDVYLSQYPKGKYFALARNRIKKLQDEVAAEASRKELENWDAAVKSGSEAGYSAYLKTWPAGRYVSLAQARLRKLQTDLAAQALLREEDSQWNLALETRTSAAMKSYLEKYPNGRYAKEARQNDEEYQRAPVIPPRPQLPVTISEDIWQTLERSPAYLNLPQPRTVRVTSQSTVQMHYTGSKSSSLPTPAAYNQSQVKEVTPLGGKCYKQQTVTNSKGNPHSMELYMCGFVPVAVAMNDKTASVINRLEMSGSLFPLRVGARESESLTSSYISDSKYDSTGDNKCSVVGKVSAHDLHPKLTGTAWRLDCSYTYSMAATKSPKTIIAENYFLEELGVFLSDIGVMDTGSKKYVIPTPGTQTVIIADGEYGSRVTTTYQSYDWSMGAEQPEIKEQVSGAESFEKAAAAPTEVMDKKGFGGMFDMLKK